MTRIKNIKERMEEEFYDMLVSNSESFSEKYIHEVFNLINVGEIEHDESPLVLIPTVAVESLNKSASALLSAGHAKTCCQIYIQVRGSVLMTCMTELKLYPSQAESVHKLSWQNVESIADDWLPAVGPAIRVLLASERLLCESVFSEDLQWAEYCFASISKPAIGSILGFANSVAMSKRVPEKLFKVLDFYESLSGYLPVFFLISTGKLCEPFRNEFKLLVVRLAEASRAIFAEFENNILHDTSAPTTKGGSVHGITRYVVNYLIFAYSYKSTLKELFFLENGIQFDERGCIIKKFVQNPNAGEGSVALSEEEEEEGEDGDGSVEGGDEEEEEGEGEEEDFSLLADTVLFKFHVLKMNIEKKARMFKDNAQAAFFLMNNAYYMANKVKDSELRQLLGDDWIREQVSVVRKHANTYFKLTWNKILTEIRWKLPPAQNRKEEKINRYLVKERFKMFNSLLEDILLTQGEWAIMDKTLCEELRCAIKQPIISQYQVFYDMYAPMLKDGKHPQKHLKYPPLTLEEMCHTLFKGPN